MLIDVRFGESASRQRAALTLCLVLLGPMQSLRAHHSFSAVYDQAKPVRVVGTVVRLDWKNPHAVLHVATVDASGAAVAWSFEMGAPRVLTSRLGWSVDSVKPGDRVTVEGFLARNGGQVAAAQTITTVAGGRLRSVLPFR